MWKAINVLKDRRQRVAAAVLKARCMEEDEINLSDLWQVLLRRKAVVFGVVSVTTAMAVAYILFVTPVYRVETVLRMPLPEDVQGTGYTQRNAYEHFIRILKSRSLQQRYLEKYNAAHHGAGARGNKVSGEEFDRVLLIQERNVEVKVSLEAPDAKSAVEYVNGLVAAANEETIHFLKSSMGNKLDNSKRTLRMQLSVMRQEAKRRRESRIVELEEAARIAERLGIRDHIVATLAAGKSVVLMSMKGPLYMRGTKALRAEIAVLRERKSDDPFISRVAELKDELAGLKLVPPPDLSHVSSVRILRAATVPGAPINGRKRVMMTALFGGLALGVFAAFLVDFFVRARKERAQSGQEIAG